MQRILITGSEGLIGSALVRELESEEIQLRKLDLRLAPGSIAHGDVRNLEDLRRVMSGCTGVIHLAAVSRVKWGERDPQMCLDTNLGGTLEVLKAAETCHEKPWVIYASSREVYGESEAFPVIEDAPLKPVNVYGRSKAQAEQAVLKACNRGLCTAVVRLSNVYGSVDDHADRVVPAFARGAVEGTALRVDGRDHTFDFTHLDDTVRGILAVRDALESGEESLPPIHLLTGQPTTLGELAEMAVEAAGSHSFINEASPRDYDVAQFWGDPSRARELLGWQAEIGIEDGVRRLVRDFEVALKTSAAVRGTV